MATSSASPGRWLKLARAREHLRALEPLLDALLGSEANEAQTITITCGFDPHDQTWVCRTGAIKQVEDNEIGLLIGDAVHNMRGALDHLVWDLSILDHGAWPIAKDGRPVRTQFPICVDKFGRHGFCSRTVQDVHLDHISPAHRAEIERFQPYITGNETLVLLAQISNEDKHRVVRTVVVSDLASQPWVRATRDCEVTSTPPIIQGRLEPNAEILRLPLRSVGSEPYVDVIFERLLSVTFPDGTNVKSWLAQAAQVVEEILMVFEANLTTPEAQMIRQAADAIHRAPL